MSSIVTQLDSRNTTCRIVNTKIALKFEALAKILLKRKVGGNEISFRSAAIRRFCLTGRAAAMLRDQTLLFHFNKTLPNFEKHLKLFNELSKQS